MHEVVAGVELRDGTRPRLTGDEVLPGGLDVVAERRDRAEARDHDSPISIAVERHQCPFQ